jgi:hypothetical protein
MEVDQPAATSNAATPVPTTIISEANTGTEAGAVPDLAPAAAAADTAGTAALSAPVSTPTGTQSGSVSGYSTEVLGQKKDPGENSNAIVSIRIRSSVRPYFRTISKFLSCQKTSL